MRIMMSAASSVVARSTIWRLLRLGHYVIGHDSNPHGDCDTHEMHRSPPANDRMFLPFIRRHDYDLYLPRLDQELHLDIPKMICSPKETIEIFTNKAKQHYELADADLPVPATAGAVGKVICKPIHGRGSKGIIVTDSRYVIADALSADYHVQQFIEGDEYTIDVLTDLNGQFLYALPRLRIAAAGVSTVGEIRIDMRLIHLAREVVERFRFQGPINIQVIRDARGVDHIIEVNPRLAGSFMFTVLAGWDILADTIKVWQDNTFIPPEKVNEFVVRRHYVEEIV